MWEMFWHSVALFLKGKLFQNPGHFFRQALIGIVCGAVLCVALLKISGSLALAVPVGALVSGALQPWLFKNLKYP